MNYLPQYQHFKEMQMKNYSYFFAFNYLVQDLIFLLPRGIIYLSVFKEKSYQKKLNDAYQKEIGNNNNAIYKL